MPTDSAISSSQFPSKLASRVDRARDLTSGQWGFSIRWLPTFLGFIVGGALASAVIGPVTNPSAAFGGGLLAGAVIGAGQWLALRGRVPGAEWWIPATAVGQAVGLTAGAALVDYKTGLADLAIQGAVTGLGIGVLQALVLRRHLSAWFRWVAFLPPLWALGWIATSVAGVDVDQHFTNFGAVGALVVTVLSGFVLNSLLPLSGRAESAVQPAKGSAL